MRRVGGEVWERRGGTRGEEEEEEVGAKAR